METTLQGLRCRVWGLGFIELDAIMKDDEHYLGFLFAQEICLNLFLVCANQKTNLLSSIVCLLVV